MNDFIKRYSNKQQNLKAYSPVFVIWAFLIALIFYQGYQMKDAKEILMSSAFNENVLSIYSHKGDVYLELSNCSNKKSK